MYAATDPRAVMDTAPSSRARAASTDDIGAPDFLDFTVLPPDAQTSGGGRQWITRGQNLVLVYTEPTADDPLWSDELTTEQVILLAVDDSAINATIDGVTHEAAGAGIAVIPPGRCEVVSTGSGPLVQLIEAGETAWARRASNATAHESRHPRVAPLKPWPEPVGGHRWRWYPMAEVPDEPGRFGRLFRTRSFMVNFSAPKEGPRDPHHLSPHFHEDFEQYSLALAGTFVHHIQTPWGPDATQWRPEDHVEVASPSLTVIPPPTVHTSEAIGHGTNQLVDIFCGPRADFSARPGWVLNADDYPEPT